MAWLEREPSGQFHIRFRIGSRKFRRSLKTKSESEAETRRVRLEETLRLVESGRLTVPANVDVATYLLSDGQLEQPLGVAFKKGPRMLPVAIVGARSLGVVFAP
ncbi:MAG: hypothetical protein HQ581_11130 [Planctomycetes bacterium]|nr:hypothetical protein [Planctomycetota bacterium]